MKCTAQYEGSAEYIQYYLDYWSTFCEYGALCFFMDVQDDTFYSSAHISRLITFLIHCYFWNITKYLVCLDGCNLDVMVKAHSRSHHQVRSACNHYENIKHT